MIVYGDDQRIADWVAQRIPHLGRKDFGDCVALGVASSTKIMAGVVYYDYQPAHSTIQLSIAAENFMWARRENIRELLAYPFQQIGVHKAWIATPLSSEHALKTFYRIGFKREAVLAHQFGRRKHAVIARMLKPDFDRMYGGQ